MSEKINKSDIIEDKILSAFINEAIEAEKRIKAFDDRLKLLAKTFREDLSKSTDLNIDNLQKLNALEKEAEKRVKQKQQNVKSLSTVEQERLNIQKAVEKAQAQKIVADSKENKELQKLRAEKNKINKATRDEIKANERSRDAYSRLVDETRDAKNESKRLGARLRELRKEGRQNEKGFKDLEEQYNETTRNAKVLDAELKDLDKTVGDNFRNVGNYESATSKLTSGLKTLAGAAGLGALVGGLGSVTKELSRAENQARLFFNTSEEGTKEIAQEAMILAKVFDKDVNDVLRAANSLSKQFGIDGNEALNLINQGFEKGGDVSGELVDNITEYSTLLRLAGLNAEQSISIITQSQQQGVFSDKGIDAIKEATLSLREMTPPAQEALEAIGMSAEQVQKDIASGTKTYFDVIQDISTRTNEVGENTQAAGMILADVFKGAGEDAGDFIFSLGEMNTSLEELEDQNKGVEGAIQNLTREFYEFVFGVEDALDVNNRFASVINFVANNLSTILGILGRVVGYWAAYRLQIISVNSAKSGLLRSLFDTIKSLPRLIRGLKGASFSFRSLGTAMKSIPFVAIIAGLVELVTWLWNSEEATNANTEAEKELNDELERGNEIRKLRVQNEKEIADLVDQREKLSQTQLKNLRNRIQEEIALSEERGSSIIQAEKEIERAEFNRFRNEQELAQLRKELQETTNQFERDGLRQKIELLEEEQSDLETRLKLQKQGIELTDDESASQEQLNEWLSLVNPLIKQNTSRKKENTKATEKLTGAQEWQNKKNDEFLDQLDEYLEKRRQQRKDQQDEMDRIESGDFEVDIGEAPILPEDEVDEVTDQQKELYDTINTAQENITKAYEDHVDRRIELAQKEIESQKELRNILKAQAEAGNIDAQDSIKATIEAEREKEAEIIRLEKRKQQVQMISQGIQTYLNLLEGGEKPAAALAQTAITSQGLIALLSGLQGFWTGTDYAPEGLAWTQEKGAEIITDKKGNIKSLGSEDGAQLTYLNKGDKVKNATETTKFLNSFENLNNEQRMPKQDVAGNSYDIMLLGSKLDRIERAIKTQPKSNSDFQTITKSLSVLTKTTNSGGDKSISKHYIKR